MKLTKSMLLFLSVITALTSNLTEKTIDISLEASQLGKGYEPEYPKHSYSGFVYEQIRSAAQWAKISYCTVLNPTFQPGPLAEACPNIEFCADSEGFQVVEVFKPDLRQLELSGTAYVAVDNDKEKVLIIFRGSIFPGDWITDFIFPQCPYVPVLSNDGLNEETFAQVTKKTESSEISRLIKDNSKPFDGCEDCAVHCGVYVAYTKFIKDVFAAVKTYLDRDYQLMISGHSLGGGYTYLAAMDFILAGYEPVSITLESLRIGNPAWNALLDEKYNTKGNAEIIAQGGDLPIPSLTRVYQTADLVPRLPPNLPGFPNYTHAGLEFEITKVSLPHLKEDVDFKGPANNYVNAPFQYKLEDWRSVTFLPHSNTFFQMGPPCSDEIIFE